MRSDLILKSENLQVSNAGGSEGGKDRNVPTPIVLTKDSVKVSSVYRTSNADFPTPESPIIKILNK